MALLGRVQSGELVGCQRRGETPEAVGLAGRGAPRGRPCHAARSCKGCGCLPVKESLRGCGPQVLGGAAQRRALSHPLRSPKPALAGAETIGTARRGALPTPGTVLQPAPQGTPGPPGHPCQKQQEWMGEQLGRPQLRDAPASWPFPREQRKWLRSLPCPRAAASDTVGSPAQGPAAILPPQTFTCGVTGRAAQRLLEEEAAGKAARAAGQLWGGEARLSSRQSSAVHAPRSRASNGKRLLSVTVNQIGEIRGLFA